MICAVYKYITLHYIILKVEVHVFFFLQFNLILKSPISLSVFACELCFSEYYNVLGTNRKYMLQIISFSHHLGTHSESQLETLVD